MGFLTAVLLCACLQAGWSMPQHYIQEDDYDYSGGQQRGQQPQYRLVAYDPRALGGKAKPSPSPRPTLSPKSAADQQVKILKQVNRINDDGSYTYGFEAGDGSFKIETRDQLGNVKGKFGFLDASGDLKTVEYNAGNGTGYTASGDFLPPSAGATQVTAVPVKPTSSGKHPQYLQVGPTEATYVQTPKGRPYLARPTHAPAIQYTAVPQYQPQHHQPQHRQVIPQHQPQHRQVIPQHQPTLLYQPQHHTGGEAAERGPINYELEGFSEDVDQDGFVDPLPAGAVKGKGHGGGAGGGAGGGGGGAFKASGITGNFAGIGSQGIGGHGGISQGIGHHQAVAPQHHGILLGGFQGGQGGGHPGAGLQLSAFPFQAAGLKPNGPIHGAHLGAFPFQANALGHHPHTAGQTVEVQTFPGPAPKPVKPIHHSQSPKSPQQAHQPQQLPFIDFEGLGGHNAILGGGFGGNRGIFGAGNGGFQLQGLELGGPHHQGIRASQAGLHQQEIPFHLVAAQGQPGPGRFPGRAQFPGASEGLVSHFAGGQHRQGTLRPQFA